MLQCNIRLGCYLRAAEYTPDQIARLAKFPILIVFGDHLDPPPSIGPSWNDAFKDCEAFVAKIKAIKGNASMLHPVDLGIPGNSHMIMQDKNNLQIADLLMRWIDQN